MTDDDLDQAGLPRTGALGWLALHAGLVEPRQMQRLLRQQRDGAGGVPLGRLLEAEGVLEAEQIESLLELQRTWRRLCAEHDIDARHAEILVQLLDVRGALALEALERCLNAPVGEGAGAMTRVRALVDMAERATGRRGAEPPVRPAPTPEDLARLPSDTAPRAGRLGWLALRAGMVDAVELQLCLQLQIERPELGKQIGEMLVARGLVDADQLTELLALQQAWTELCRIHALDDRLAENLAQLLAGQQRFDTDSVKRALVPDEMDSGMRLLLEVAGVNEPPGDNADADPGDRPDGADGGRDD